MRIRLGTLLLACVLPLLVVVSACDDLTLPVPGDSLLGNWLVAEGGEVWGVDTGNMAFHSDRTVVLTGYVVGSGGHESYEVSGTWTESNAGTVTLTLGGEETSWDLDLGADEAVFYEVAGDRAFRLIRP